MLVLQKLNPLIRLRKKIALYGDGDMNISFKTNSCDEIGLVSNEIEKTKNKKEECIKISCHYSFICTLIFWLQMYTHKIKFQIKTSNKN